MCMCIGQLHRFTIVRKLIVAMAIDDTIFVDTVTVTRMTLPGKCVLLRLHASLYWTRRVAWSHMHVYVGNVPLADCG